MRDQISQRDLTELQRGDIEVHSKGPGAVWDTAWVSNNYRQSVPDMIDMEK